MATVKASSEAQEAARKALAQLANEGAAAKQGKTKKKTATSAPAKADVAAILRNAGLSEEQIAAAMKTDEPAPKTDSVKIEYGEAHGRPTICLTNGRSFPFHFGRSKARLLIAAIEQGKLAEIEAFANSQD